MKHLFNTVKSLMISLGYKIEDKGLPEFRGISEETFGAYYRDYHIIGLSEKASHRLDVIAHEICHSLQVLTQVGYLRGMDIDEDLWHLDPDEQEAMVIEVLVLLEEKEREDAICFINKTKMELSHQSVFVNNIWKFGFEEAVFKEI